MRHLQLCLAAVVALLAALLAPAAARAAQAPPAELFFKPAEIGQVALSPSGRWLAMTSAHATERIALVVFDLHDWGKVSIAAAFNDADIRRFDWVNDERLVFDVIDLQAGGGEQRFAAGLFSVRRDGSERRDLVALRRHFVSEMGSRARREPLSWNHQLLHIPGDGGDEVIVGEFSLDSSGEVRDVHPKRLNVVDGQTRGLAAGSPPDTRQWWFDAQGRPRVVAAVHQGRVRLYLKAPDGADWQLVSDHPRFAAPFEPRFFDADGTLYVTVASGPQGHAQLRRFDVERRAPQAEAVVSAPGFDFRGALVSEWAGGRTLGVRVETDAETTVWFDPQLKALQQEADQKLPGRVNRLSCRRCGRPDMVVVVDSHSDRDPGLLVLYRADTRSWRVVGQRRKGVDPARSAQLDFHRIKARDGRDLPLWVTTPPGAGPGPKPAVVLVHGGPWVRGGHWRWDPMAQFLASRGYLVIEPEFRGSTGYGAAHFRAGFRQWGLAMQDDVADALQWAVDQGLADGSRACIAGASYGGYATLMGLVRHPDRWRCGVAWAAVSDPRLLFRWSVSSDIGDEGRLYQLPQLIGDPVADAAYLDSVSPVEQAGRIKAPLLLAMGARDRRVPLEHGTRMRDALAKAGNAPDWVLYDDEAHGWLAPRNQVDFAQRVERFLARHLGPGPVNAPAASAPR